MFFISGGGFIIGTVQMKIKVNPNAFEKQLHIRSMEEANEAMSKQIIQLKQQNA